MFKKTAAATVSWLNSIWWLVGRDGAVGGVKRRLCHFLTLWHRPSMWIGALICWRLAQFDLRPFPDREPSPKTVDLKKRSCLRSQFLFTNKETRTFVRICEPFYTLNKTVISFALSLAFPPSNVSALLKEYRASKSDYLYEHTFTFPVTFVCVFHRTFFCVFVFLDFLFFFFFWKYPKNCVTENNVRTIFWHLYTHTKKENRKNQFRLTGVLVFGGRMMCARDRWCSDGYFFK